MLEATDESESRLVRVTWEAAARYRARQMLPETEHRPESSWQGGRIMADRLLEQLDRSEDNLVKAAREVLARRRARERATEEALRETLPELEARDTSRRSTRRDPDVVEDEATVRGAREGLRRVLAKRAADKALRLEAPDEELEAAEQELPAQEFQDPDDVVVRGIGKGLQEALRRRRASQAVEKALRQNRDEPPTDLE